MWLVAPCQFECLQDTGIGFILNLAKMIKIMITIINTIMEICINL
ncbi:hypothetical protein HMPREF1570_0354 [Klebsiella oxytoca KA-2]|nr:hypothetical protein HMPREF1570_0354 [Klebsiella oxytoca KA-2]